MKTFFLGTMLSLAVLSVYATEVKNEKTNTVKETTVNFSGVVVDGQTHEALVGVKVELAGTGMITYTDFDGSYTFNKVTPGNYEVLATYVSYESAHEQVDLIRGANRSISLKSAE